MKSFLVASVSEETRRRRIFSALVLCLGLCPTLSALAQAPHPNSSISFGQSYHNDVSPALRDFSVLWPPSGLREGDEKEANLNPKVPFPLHVDVADPIVDCGILGLLAPDAMPAAILNFDGIPFPGVNCNCRPPDTNGAIGQSQYVQIVNKGYQVFDKVTGASVLGPLGITSLWSGFGGVCQTAGFGDPIALYDHIANRWLISQFAGPSGIPTDECIAISTTSDATGTYNRYGFHLGTNFFDYPHLGVWPDGYYMAMNVFNSAGTAFLGPQAFAFDRAKMLAGLPATFVTPGNLGSSGDPFLPSDIDVLFSQLPAPAIPLSRSRVTIHRPIGSGSSTPISLRPLIAALHSSEVRRRRGSPCSVPQVRVCLRWDQPVTWMGWPTV